MRVKPQYSSSEGIGEGTHGSGTTGEIRAKPGVAYQDPDKAAPAGRKLGLRGLVEDCVLVAAV